MKTLLHSVVIAAVIAFALPAQALGAETDSAEINAVIYVIDSTTGQVVGSRKVKGEASRSGGAGGGSPRIGERRTDHGIDRCPEG